MDEQLINTQAKNLTKAIFQHESGMNYNAKGDAGTSSGAGQWQPDTWKAQAKDVLGDENAPMTPDNQSVVAQGTIRNLIKQGKNAAQIAAIWNSGSDQDWQKKVGTATISGKPVKYNVPQYVKSVTDLYHTYKAEASGTPDSLPPAVDVASQKAALEAQGQPVSTQDNRATPTFGGNILRGIITPFARLGLTLERADQGIMGGGPANLAQAAHSKYLGDITPVGQQGSLGQRIKDVVGNSAQIIANGVGAEGVGTAAETGLKGLVVQGLKEGAITGAKVGALQAGGNALTQNDTLGNTLAKTGAGAVEGAIGGGVTGGVAGGLGAGITALAGREAGSISDGAIDKSIAQTLGSGGKRTAGSLARTIEQNRQGFTSLLNRGEGLPVNDIDGNVVPFNPSKATLGETIQAHSQVKSNIYDEYTKLAQQSGDQGALVDVQPIIDKLNATAQETGRRNLAVDKATNLADDLKRNFPKGKATPSQVQSFVEDLNQETLGAFKSGNFNAKADVAANTAKELRDAADSTIQNSTGKQYQALRNEYGAVKSIENGLVKRFQQQTRKVGNGIPGYIDIAGNVDLLSSFLQQNPATFAKGSILKIIANTLKNNRDPEQMLQNTFSAIKTNQEGSPGLIGKLAGKKTP